MQERSKCYETGSLGNARYLWKCFHFVTSITFLNGLLLTTTFFSTPLPSHAKGGTYILAWDASPDTEVVGYNIYFGNAPRSYDANLIFGNNICNGQGCRVEVHLEQGTWFLSVTAFNSDGIESDFSEELEVKVGTQDPTIVYPNGTLKWILGCNYDILWENFGSSKISISLLRNGINVKQISKKANNTGGFSWTVDRRIQPGDGYQVFVQGQGESAVSRGHIEMVASSISSPQSGEALTRGHFHEIQWDPQTFCGSHVNVELFRRAKKVSTIANNIPNTGSFQWSIPESLQPGTQYRIKIGSSMSPNCYGLSQAYFTIQ